MGRADCLVHVAAPSVGAHNLIQEGIALQPRPLLVWIVLANLVKKRKEKKEGRQERSNHGDSPNCAIHEALFAGQAHTQRRIPRNRRYPAAKTLGQENRDWDWA